MPLISAKCTNCGGILEVDAAKDAAICRYCGSAFITEKAINHYNTYHQTINQIHAEQVIVQGDLQRDFVVEGGVLKAYKGASMDVVVPEGVRKIAENCFSDMEIVSVVLPEGVTTICDGAFSRCYSLARVEFPQSLTYIGRWAFRCCANLRTVRLPDGLALIGAYAFADCEGLKNISFSKNLEILSEGAFQNCKSLVSVSLPEGMRSLEKDAFRECVGLTSVYIPGSLKTMGGGVFAECANLRKIDSPILDQLIMDTNMLNANFHKVPYVWEVNRMRNNRCRHCGGRLRKGLFSKAMKCERCGKERDY